MLVGPELAGLLSRIGEDLFDLKKQLEIAGLLGSLGVAWKPRWWPLVVWNSGGHTSERNSQIFSLRARPSLYVVAVIFADFMVKLVVR